jgi:Pyruvate/2-oxoacid:ferredoxin oxidoreductase delta subunit
MELDETGFPQPTGEYETLETDTVVLAVGQESDLDWLAGLRGVCVVGGSIAVNGALMTGHPGVFAGGDAIGGERTATHSIGHGSRAARAIDRYLRELDAETPDVAAVPTSIDQLNTWYYSDAPATVRPELEAARRTDTFAEVVHGLTEDNARYEARRCLSCGTCFGCDNCYGVCPDNAVSKPGFDTEGRPSYAIDLDFCKGCGLCVTECPSGAIVMVPESSAKR